MPRTLEKTPRAKTSPTDDARWAAFEARDPSADGTFYTAVATTGIYCRPSCPARKPHRHNVTFYETCAEAEAAGYRSCKRCQPDHEPRRDQHAAKVSDACRFIEIAEDEPSLAELASRAGLSPHHFHRMFRAIAGVTPKAYAVAHRQKRVRAELARTASVTDAIYGAGFKSNGRFYADSEQVLGMTPTEYRAGGENTEIRYMIGDCSLGQILVAASEKGVCSIMLGDDSDSILNELKDRFPRAKLIGGDADFEQTVARVIAFVETPRAGLDLPLDIRGTAFQHRVWQALRDIPAGSTASYTEIAERIGAPKAVRAVAGACAVNAIAVAIPCHRVIGRDGHLTGYRWGVDRKRKLLDREKP